MSNKNPKGFSGLSQLHSKNEDKADSVESDFQSETPTDTIIASTSETKFSSKHENTVSADSESEVTIETVQGERQKSNQSGVSWGYIFWFLLIASIFIAISQDSPNSVPKAATESNLANPTATDRKTPTPQLGTSSVVGKTNQPRNETLKLQYNKPPIGSNNILSVSQIRWCTREIMRIDAMRNIFDTNGGIGEFNRIVNDYNSRCSNYRYRQGDYSKAEREIEPFRATIVSEAKQEAKRIDQRFKTNSNASKKIISNKPDPQLTREVQRLLTDLGYNPGPIDGDYGRGTANAIVAFQRDLSVYADGNVDKALIVQLQRETENVSATQAAGANNQSLMKSSSVLDLSRLSSVDREGIISSCRYSGSPADVYSCQKRELGKLRNSGGAPDLSRLSSVDRKGIIGSCRYSGSPADVYSCQKRELGKLRNSEGAPDLSRLSSVDREGIIGSCRYSGSPADVYSCQKRELGKLRNSGGAPNLSRLSTSDREGIISSCRYSGSPGDVYSCQKRELGKLGNSGGAPNLSRLSTSDREGIISSCRYSGSPADVYSCQKRELGKLRNSGGAPDLSRLSSVDREGIISSCRYSGSPADVYSCQKRELLRL